MEVRPRGPGTATSSDRGYPHERPPGAPAGRGPSEVAAQDVGYGAGGQTAATGVPSAPPSLPGCAPEDDIVAMRRCGLRRVDWPSSPLPKTRCGISWIES